MTQAGVQRRKPGPHWAVGIVVIVIGTVVGVGGMAKGIANVVHDVRGTATGLTPLDVQRHLDTGTWELYSGYGSRGLLPSDVTVTSSSGGSIQVRGPGSATESITSNGRTYVGNVRFTISQSGEYQIDVHGTPGTPVLLSESLGDLARHDAGWFVLMGFGILIGFLGVILLIVGVVRRSRARRAPMATTGGYPTSAYLGTPIAAQQPGLSPPPGWYPDTSVPGTLRWWDGTKWTDQTHQQ